LGADGDGGLLRRGPRGGVWGPMVEHQRRAFTRGVKKGVRIVLGTDVGGFPWTELNRRKSSSTTCSTA